MTFIDPTKISYVDGCHLQEKNLFIVRVIIDGQRGEIPFSSEKAYKEFVQVIKNQNHLVSVPI